MSPYANYEKLSNLNNIFGIWRISPELRVTFVCEGWLIVWDHRSQPPVRHDCKTHNHHETCTLAATKLRELAAS